MKSQLKSPRFLPTLGLFLSLVSLTFGLTAFASVPLPVGAGPVPLPGSTAALEADLAGGVVHDQVIPFEIVNGGGAILFKGKLQNRVVKSGVSGLLHFYYRIRETTPGFNGIIHSVITSSFAPTPAINVDWRPDGLGLVNPIKAQRSAGDGRMVKFDFERDGHVLVGGRESKFFFIKTKARAHKIIGQTKIQLTSGESVVLRTAAPIL